MGQYPIFDLFTFFAQRCVGDLAVPTFFVISGYLFFLGEEFTTIAYKRKIAKRVKSLFVPYILWNLLFMAFCFCIYFFNPSLMVSMKIYCEQFDLYSFGASLLWNPVLGPFWYIRDLFVLAFFSIPFYYVLKKIPILLLSVLMLLWVGQIGLTLPGIGIRATFFFSIGAVFSIHHKNFDLLFSRYSIWLLLLFLFMSSFDIYCEMSVGIYKWFHQLTLLIGVFSVLGVTSRYSALLTKLYVPILAESSLFIFAFHMFIINIPNKFWVLLLPVNTFTLILMQLLIPAIVCVVSIGLYCLLKKMVPYVLSPLMGGRV